MPSKQNGGPAAAPSCASGIDALAELSRRQLAAAVQGGCALFQGFETLRGIQQRTAHEALAQYEEAGKRLARPCAVSDLLALQADLMQYDLQGAALYWQQLGAAALEMQRRLLASVTAAETTALQDAASTMQDLSTAMPVIRTILTGNGARQPSRAHD